MLCIGADYCHSCVLASRLLFLALPVQIELLLINPATLFLVATENGALAPYVNAGGGTCLIGVVSASYLVFSYVLLTLRLHPN